MTLTGLGAMGGREPRPYHARRSGADVVAERLGVLALAGDADGTAAWQAIARRIVELEPAGFAPSPAVLYPGGMADENPHWVVGCGW